MLEEGSITDCAFTNAADNECKMCDPGFSLDTSNHDCNAYDPQDNTGDTYCNLVEDDDDQTCLACPDFYTLDDARYGNKDNCYACYSGTDENDSEYPDCVQCALSS